ncbi:unnamed protein product, partial [Ectocarpus sp. 12 AP-2014]
PAIVPLRRRSRLPRRRSSSSSNLRGGLNLPETGPHALPERERLPRRGRRRRDRGTSTPALSSGGREASCCRRCPRRQAAIIAGIGSSAYSIAGIGSSAYSSADAGVIDDRIRSRRSRRRRSHHGCCRCCLCPHEACAEGQPTPRRQRGGRRGC